VIERVRSWSQGTTQLRERLSLVIFVPDILLKNCVASPLGNLISWKYGSIIATPPELVVLWDPDLIVYESNLIAQSVGIFTCLGTPVTLVTGCQNILPANRPGLTSRTVSDPADCETLALRAEALNGLNASPNVTFVHPSSLMIPEM